MAAIVLRLMGFIEKVPVPPPTITKVLRPSTLNLFRPRLLSNKWERSFLTLNWERSPKADDKCGDEFKGFPSKQVRLFLEK